MSEKEVTVGEQKAQREFKGYTIVTEVIIVLLQALAVMVAIDVAAGLVVYMVVWAGPTALRVVVGMAMLLGIPALAFGAPPKRVPENWTTWREQKDRRVVTVLLVGAVVFTAAQVGMTRLEPLWPWDWLGWGGFYNAWSYTWWVGVLVCCGILSFRFIREVISPFWDKPDRAEAPEPPKQKVVVRDRPVYVHANGQRRNPVEAGPYEPEPASLDEELEEDSFYYDLYEFILQAHTRGLERSAWIGQDVPTYHFDSGQRLSKSYFNHLMGELERSKHVAWDGPGTAKRFAADLETIMANWGYTQWWADDGYPGRKRPSPTRRAGGRPGGRETPPMLAGPERKKE